MSFHDVLQKLHEKSLPSEPACFILFTASIAFLAYLLAITHKEDYQTHSVLRIKAQWFFFHLPYRSFFIFSYFIVVLLVAMALIKILIDPYKIDIIIKYILIFFVYVLTVTVIYNLEVLKQKTALLRASFEEKEIEKMENKYWRDNLIANLAAIRKTLANKNDSS
jgi:hypothetical protein